MTSVSLRSRPSGFSSGSSSASVRERIVRVVRYRRILALLVSRDLKVRYAGSALGYLWTILDPLLMSLVYWFVFTQIFNRTAGPEFDPYLLYLVSGQLVWAWFNGGVTGVTRALRSEAQMVRSTNVPRELWVLRVILSKGVEYFFGLPVLVVFGIVYAVGPTKYTLLLPLAWLMIVVLLLGIGLILAPLCVLVRDVERIVPIIMRVMFYASPILYSVSNAPASIQSVYAFNPTVGFLTIVHSIFFPAAIQETRTKTVGGHWEYDNVHVVIERGVPTLKGDNLHLVGGHQVRETISHWDWIWHSGLTSIVVLVIGLFVFVRLERPMLKEI